MHARKLMKTLVTGIAGLTLLGFLAVAQAGEMEPKHKLVIQVSTDDVRTHAIALNNAMNLQKAVGQDNIAIEIVAYGPGLGLLSGKSPQSKRVPNLAMQDITFSACGNTMNKVAKTSGSMPVLVEGVKVVPAGVLRIMELQEQGYAYVRP